jgi:hypothetical protein
VQLDHQANPGISRIDIKIAQRNEQLRRKRKKQKKREIKHRANLREEEEKAEKTRLRKYFHREITSRNIDDYRDG